MVGKASGVIRKEAIFYSGTDIELDVDVGANALPSPLENNPSSNAIGAVGLGFGNQAEGGEGVAEIWRRKRRHRYGDAKKGLLRLKRVGYWDKRLTLRLPSLSSLGWLKSETSRVLSERG